MKKLERVQMKNLRGGVWAEGHCQCENPGGEGPITGEICLGHSNVRQKLEDIGVVPVVVQLHGLTKQDAISLSYQFKVSSILIIVYYYSL